MVRSVLLGVVVLIAVAAPGAAFGWLGYHLWGDGGQPLLLAPYLFVILIAAGWIIGETIRGRR